MAFAQRVHCGQQQRSQPGEAVGLNRTSISNIEFDELVRQQGAMISRSSFRDGDLSGMLLRRDGQPPVIGANDSQPPLRQRFTIARELGHLLLHLDREVVLDRPVRINLRDGLSSTATDRIVKRSKRTPSLRVC
ncbi:ImmA/IrrE family metallo-endopeptidase [Streptomyces sp. NPDC059943]|uniref:ImmA/IrrE family metallo-endopeptidase n=1 Tax=Streptomyces sp. NPDC059943 TaxID=3347010 RepID=UPI00364F9989